jgi:outer membrane receptor protein involved in Fe transport
LTTRSFVLALTTFLAAVPAHAQLATSTISGQVLGIAGSPTPPSEIELRDPMGHVVRRVSADGRGRFRIVAVAPGTYDLRAESASLRSLPRRITPADGLPVEVTLQLTAQRSEEISVVESGDPSASGTTLAGETVRRAASPLRSNALRFAVAAAPGWTSEDNGLIHFRGSDDGILFVLDGIPVYERLDPQFGVAPDPATLGSVRVLSGYVPAEFGLRSGGVVEVRSRLEESRGWSGALDATLGGQHERAASAMLQGPVGGTASISLSASGERSHRFLDPVSLENIHNHGATGRLAADVLWVPGPNVVTLRAGHGGSSFEVPSDPDDEVDQRQKLAQTFATANWQRAWSARTVSQVALFGRFTQERLDGQESDRPLFAQADREQDRVGLLAAVTQERGRHRIKAGFEASSLRLDEQFRFAVTDAEQGEDEGFSEAALAQGPDDPFEFADGVRRAIASAYVQDSWRAAGHLTLEAGLRYDRSHLLLPESALSPRLGAFYDAGRATFRLSLGRFFQPPQPEFLLLSSSPQTRELSPFAEDLGTGGADVRAERQWALEAGTAVQVGRLRADVAVWRRWIRNQGDPNVFFGTTVIFPNSVARGRAKGLDVRVELPRRRGVSGFVTYTLAKVDQFGPIDGGLFLEDDVIEIGPGTRFTPDHDQRHALTAEVGYENTRTGSWIALSGRFRTGTPLEVDDEALADLSEREGADLVDLESGRVKPYTVLDVQVGQRLLRRGRLEASAQAALTNVTGARYAFNFGNPFSGTHFGAPRTLRVDLKVAVP